MCDCVVGIVRMNIKSGFFFYYFLSLLYMFSLWLFAVLLWLLVVFFTFCLFVSFLPNHIDLVKNHFTWKLNKRKPPVVWSIFFFFYSLLRFQFIHIRMTWYVQVFFFALHSSVCSFKNLYICIIQCTTYLWL